MTEPFGPEDAGYNFPINQANKPLTLLEKVAKLDYEFGAPLDYWNWDTAQDRDKNWCLKKAKAYLQAILSDPSICEIEVGAELPVISYVNGAYYEVAKRTQQDMKKANWVKKKDGG